jgi:hypothetical protein
MIMEPDNSANGTYRATFGEYARSLDALQRLMDSGTAVNGHLESAIEEVERARLAHNSARDLLASELGAPSQRAAIAGQCD